MAQVDSASVCTFNEFKIGKAPAGQNGYLKLALTKGAISITESGPRMEWEELCRSVLSDSEPCWLVYHFHYTTCVPSFSLVLLSLTLFFYSKAGAQRTKLILLQWIPTNAEAKDKVLAVLSPSSPSYTRVIDDLRLLVPQHPPGAARHCVRGACRLTGGGGLRGGADEGCEV